MSQKFSTAQRSRSVRSLLLLPLGLVFLIILFSSYYVLYLNYSGVDTQLAKQSAEQFNQSIKEEVEELVQVLLSLEQIILSQESLPRLIKNADRKGINALYNATYAHLEDKLNVTHFYFHDENLTNITRLHDKSRFGDEITRVTGQRAISTGRASYGLELGVLGTYTLRVVQPIFEDSQLLGFIELGVEFENVLSNSQIDLMSEWVLFIRKEFLSKPDWTYGSTVFGRKSKWEFIKTYVVSASELIEGETSWESNITKIVNSLDEPGHHGIVQIGDRSMIRIRLTDVEGKIIGWLVAFPNLQEQKDQALRQLVFSMFLIVMFMLVVIGYLFQALRKVDEKLWDSQERLIKSATEDSLTRLPNRKLLMDRLGHALNKRKVYGQRLALLFIDLDNFKQVNDGHGHAIGDHLLRRVADTLRELTQSENTVARLGGDEFVILLEKIDTIAEVQRLASQMVSVFEKSVLIKRQEIQTGLSIGICIYPDDGNSASDLLRNADAALYRAKEQGKNQFCFYERHLTEKIQKQLVMETRLRRAIRNDELNIAYQPQFCIKGKKLSGVEALARWEDEELGVVSPSEFIPLAEKSSLIKELGEWVLTEACKQGVRWSHQGVEFHRLAINVSGVQLKDDNFSEHLQEILQRTGFPANRLEIEITESTLMENFDRMIQILHRLKNEHILIAIDDFGTGYSSLSYLKQLPIHRLKIDKSFVNDIPENKDDSAITRAIVSLAKNLGLDLVAEGVERERQLLFLEELECDFVQGYYLAKPMLPDQFALFMRSESKDS